MKQGKHQASCYSSMSPHVQAAYLLTCCGFALTFPICLPAGAVDAQKKGSESEARGQLAAARRALQAGNTIEAKTRLELALKSDPALEDAHVALGTLEFQQGNDASATAHLRRALEWNAKSFPAHYNLALVYLHEHKQNEGRQELERAVSLDPRNPDANYNLGLILLVDRPICMND
jgi:Tfp pilus assembly protein PilF